MTDIILKNESFRIIGICMEIHNELGMGFSEIVYKDALEYEFGTNKSVTQEKKSLISIIREPFSHIHSLLILLFIIKLSLR